MLHAIPNHSASSVFKCDPWDYTPSIPEELLENKKAFRDWCKKPSTQHAFFSGFEAMAEGMRVTKKEHPPYKCSAIVADYDVTVITPEMLSKAMDDSPTEFIPNYTSLTFSGGARLVWELESPLIFPSFSAASSFLLHVSKALKLDKILPGFDAPAFRDPTKYYDVGYGWEHRGTNVIPETFSWSWLAESGRRLKMGGEDERQIPLEDIYPAIEKEFPGFWGTTPFEIGARCNRFWDSTSTNPSSAILREGGFQCFSGDFPFYSWRMLLGDAFVDKYEADRLGKVLKDFVYDGKKYWSEGKDGHWVDESTEGFKIALKTDYGLDPKTPKGGTCSELEMALREIHKHKRVKAALPFLHFPNGLMHFDGDQFLNISTVRCMEPSSAKNPEWGEGFPWLAGFLDGLFNPHDQLKYMLAWWKRFYEGGLTRRPQLGQALFLVGPSNCGKTLLNSNIIAHSVGGHMDASDFLIEGNGFTGSFIEKPIMSIDDGEASSNAKAHAKYSAKLKRVVANPSQFYNEKYAKAGQVAWYGRVIITLNDDPDALKMLPDLQESLMDKVLIFKVQRPDVDFKGGGATDKIILQELPHFLRWLVNWTPPAEVVGKARFGVTEYCHEEIHKEAVGTGSDQAFVDVLNLFFMEYQIEHKTETHWVGSPTQLLNALGTCEAVTSQVLQGYTAVRIGLILGRLLNLGYNLSRQKRTKTGAHWEICLDLAMKGEV